MNIYNLIRLVEDCEGKINKIIIDKKTFSNILYSSYSYLKSFSLFSEELKEFEEWSSDYYEKKLYLTLYEHPIYFEETEKEFVRFE